MGRSVLSLCLMSILLAACQNDRGVEAGGTAEDARDARQAEAVIRDRRGAEVGRATFTEHDHGVLMRIDVAGLTPGTHGLHIHDSGECAGPKFDSAGTHLNPNGRKHGYQSKDGPHLGDLNNLDVSQSGDSSTVQLIDGVTLREGPTSLLRPGGTSIVVHAKPDDYLTDPAGNSGARVACGVIQRMR